MTINLMDENLGVGAPYKTHVSPPPDLYQLDLVTRGILLPAEGDIVKIELFDGTDPHLFTVESVKAPIKGIARAELRRRS